MEPPFTFIEKEVAVMLGNAIGKDKRGRSLFLAHPYGNTEVANSILKEIAGVEFF